MSQRENAPYQDKILKDQYSIEYEGHDTPNTEGIGDPKNCNHPRFTRSGKLTQLN